jgi:hypothetical protein
MDRLGMKAPNYNDRDPTPYEEGRAAYEKGLDKSDNPYDDLRQEMAAEDWAIGWMDAEEEDSEDDPLFAA